MYKHEIWLAMNVRRPPVLLIIIIMKTHPCATRTVSIGQPWCATWKRVQVCFANSSHWQVDSNSPPLETETVVVNTFDQQNMREVTLSQFRGPGFGDLFPHPVPKHTFSGSPKPRGRDSDSPETVIVERLVNALIENPAESSLLDFQPSLTMLQTWGWSSLGPSRPRYLAAKYWGLSSTTHRTDSCPSHLDSWPMKLWNIIQTLSYKVVGIVCYTIIDNQNT